MSQEHPDIPAFRAALLESIRSHNGKATWYQLRHVVARFPQMALQLMSVLRAMEADGEIETLPNPQVKGMPYYRSRTVASPPAT